MLRASRPLTLWLIWLAIALLPLRGWAASTMPVAVVAEAATAMAMAEAPSAIADLAGPCHQDADEASVAGSHSCGLCGVCHSAVASTPTLTPTLPTLPSHRPPIDPAPRDERPVQGGPDRPPRSVLA
jgi:hypothetical protein